MVWGKKSNHKQYCRDNLHTAIVAGWRPPRYSAHAPSDQVACPRHDKVPPQHGACRRKLTCPRQRSADKSGVLKARQRALAHSIKDAQLKEAKRQQKCMVDLRVARAINKQTDADPSPAGTARHARAAQLAASAMVGLFDNTFLERMLEEAKGVEEGEEEGEEESEA